MEVSFDLEELLRAPEPLDAVYVGVGVGSGICGLMADRRVAVILSGGNIERARFHQVLGGATPSAG